MAKRLHRANPVTCQRRSLRKIAAELAAARHIPWRQCSPTINQATITAMIEGPAPRNQGSPHGAETELEV